MKCNGKITILGAGNVGATIAYTLTLGAVCSEIVLIDINKEKAMGEAMDIRQGMAYNQEVRVYAGDYEDAAGSDIVIITSGAARKPGMTRIDLAHTNISILESVAKSVVKYAPDASYIVVSNPADVMTYALLKCTDLKPSQVIGSGTLIDSSRLRTSLAGRLELTAANIHGYVLGEHGDSSVVPWSTITVSGMPISKYCESVNDPYTFNTEEEKTEIEDEMRKSGATVIGYKKGTYYAIAMSVSFLCDNILRDTNAVMPVSVLMQGEYGIHDVCLSLPCIIDASGVKRVLTPVLNAEEEAKMVISGDKLKQTIAEIGL